MNNKYKIPPRFEWAAELMNIQSDQFILEIGCGAGILAQVLSRSILTGKVIATDRSSSMISQAKKRNKENMESGVIAFTNGECKNLKISRASVDSVVAFNVGFFQKDGEVELSLIRKWLKPDGKLFVFYQAPAGKHSSFVKLIRNNLIQNKFIISKVMHRSFIPAPAYGIIAVPRE